MEIQCRDCGRELEGDGVTTVLHCPEADVEDVKQGVEEIVYCHEPIPEYLRDWCY